MVGIQFAHEGELERRIMDIAGLIIGIGFRARVLHRLPGRLRIRIPALNLVPASKRGLAEAVVDGLPMPKGVKALEPSFVTGNVVLTYDTKVISEKQVIEHIEWLVKFSIKHRDKLMMVPPNDLPRVVKQLKDHFEQWDGAGKRPAREVEIPEDVWS